MSTKMWTAIGALAALAALIYSGLQYHSQPNTPSAGLHQSSSGINSPNIIGSGNSNTVK